ncbi:MULTISPECIES: PadR family transcriptional regulator [Rhodococcus]|uniref:PadR family transcriptional regulator n=1 Tax=Rhodococcus TaxID=1827 RepID=UPI001BCD31A6|nr:MULTISPECIES: PadR family transcriptional regulator [Rhodococcus]MDV7246814.1 PadR family transcriptional regulator [Rhodococcus oxybenzonivorans]MDV7278413.1 PadR family transcriptional regulator [Rhodococcus oxybenzonivorans]MDV7337931.1 PadR family transcriptional regulator [Rhodococcus oxybenzonivorans]MDV7348131.1 PadR family transcriptional regulator [Rhodococcus oxybenzonivorans]MDV8031765.1 PadR family transcriptional regulator [Rhodococcus sp. IEGM 27]
MSLRCAILTALVERPATGKELTRRFDSSIGYFWHATHQQIYRELGIMTGDGLIQPHASQVKGRGAPRTYEITETGVRYLREWVDTRQEPVPLRDPLLVRMRAAAVLGDVDLTDDIHQHLDYHRSLLQTYRDIEDRDFKGPLTSRRQRLQHLILQAGIDSELSWTEWCTKAAKQFAADRAEE